MKKIQSDSSRSGFNRKKDHTSPTRFPKKQFEFIYREKDNLPSSQAFESIIFMKSKKCDNKSSHSINKGTGKHRKQPVQQLKKAITEIEKHLKDDENRKNKKIDENNKQHILKSTIHNSSHQRKDYGDNFNKKTSHRWNKYNKVDFSSTQSTKNYKNMISPSKNMKKKEDGLNSKSNKLMKSQQTFRRQIRTRQKRREKKQNRDPEEYILLENNFVQINMKEASALEDKMLSSRQFFIEKKSKNFSNHFEYFDNSQRNVDQDTEKVFQQYLLSDSKQSEPTPIEKSAQESQQILAENNILVVQKYIVSKIKKIQKWWRSILQQKKQKQQKQLIQLIQLEKEEMQYQNNEQFQGLQNMELMEDSIIFGERVICTSQLGNNSPIKMIDDFVSTLQDPTGTEIIQSRQTAARKQLETHKTILQSLLVSKRITPQTYAEKKQMIEAIYYNNLEEIEELKIILRKNASKTVQIQKKALDDLKIIQNTDIVINNSLLDQIFGGQFGSDTNYQHKLINIPILPNDSIYNRQKSTGCHYNSQESSNSIYKKRKTNEENYEQDFQQYNKQNENQDYRTFCSGNVKVNESLNNNFKELYDQFKLREQVKIQIDKRAAIQMGILIQEIPEQQKQEIVSIDTSLNSIHRFLLAFFKYYIYYYKYDFLRLINMPFGYNIEHRLKNLQGYSDDQSYQQDQDGVIYGLEAVITEAIFQQFYQKVYEFGSGPISTARMANYQYEKVHNRALFDCFNEGLNNFRPYFQINGPPYPWNYSEKALTFYFIAQENIQQVFQKTQFKVLKWASTLCGIMVNKFSDAPIQINMNNPIDSLLQTYKQSSHPLLNQTREERLNKNEKMEIMETNHQWSQFYEQNTLNSLKVSDLIFFALLDQISDMLNKGDYTQNINNKGDQIQKQLKTGLEFFHNLSQNSSLSEFQIF